VSKLNAEAISRLIDLVNSQTMTQKDIGLRFGVSQAMVSKLKLKSERPIPGRRKYVLPIATERRDVRNAGGFSYPGLGAQIPANNMQLPKQRCEPMNATLTIGSCAHEAHRCAEPTARLHGGAQQVPRLRHRRGERRAHEGIGGRAMQVTVWQAIWYGLVCAHAGAAVGVFSIALVTAGKRKARS
jgi:hypothetical protein